MPKAIGLYHSRRLIAKRSAARSGEAWQVCTVCKAVHVEYKYGKSYVITPGNS